MKRLKRCFLAVCLALPFLLISGALAADPTQDAPWWKKRKIRFMWGQWTRSWEAGCTPDQLMTRLEDVGATVYAEAGLRKESSELISNREEYRNTGLYFDLEVARAARKHGIRYFGIGWLFDLTNFALENGYRPSQRPEGMPYSGRHGGNVIVHPCPLDRQLYEEWFLAPCLKAARTGLVDGLHLDWEPYSGRGEADVCYCDECFGTFLTRKALQIKMPPVKKRRDLLLERGLVAAYEQLFEERRFAMFRDFAQRVRAIQPDFIFAAYHVWDTPMTRGLHSDSAPLFIIDLRHYWQDHTRPWWGTAHDYYRRLGFIHIKGTYDKMLFGGEPFSNVSASQWLYDAAITSDGHWLWFEEEPTPPVWRTFAIANRRIAATERKVGRFLLGGAQSLHFATLVEWTGDPDMERKLIQRTYSLGGEHLVHLHNVHTDRPVQVRLQFPRLPEGGRWVVRDPIADLVYTHHGGEPVWDAERLEKGLMVSLERRSELFVKLSPAPGAFEVEPGGTIPSQEINMLPSHGAALNVAVAEDDAEQAKETTASVGSEDAASSEVGPTGRLVYTATRSLGFAGPQAGWAAANVISTIDSDGGNNKLLRQVKGYLWSPAWSPDGRRIAFCHYANGRGQICTMNADGSDARNVSGNQWCDKSPDWSPDGREIAFVSNHGADWEIYVMNADGSAPTRITQSPGKDQRPAWSPDGTHIAFESGRLGDLDIFVCDRDGSDQRCITGGASRFLAGRSGNYDQMAPREPAEGLPGQNRDLAWSPDSKRIAFVATGSSVSLFIASIDEGSVEGLFTWSMYLGSPCFHPDGKRLAGLFRGSQDNAGVFLRDLDGLDWPSYSDFMARARVENHVLVNADSTRLYPGGAGKVIPSWYGDGGASPRWVMKTFSGLCWSPDGQYLAFSADLDRPGEFYVYVMPADGAKTPVALPDTRSVWIQQVMWQPRQAR